MATSKNTFHGIFADEFYRTTVFPVIPLILDCAARISNQALRVRVNDHKSPPLFVVIPFNYLRVDPFVSETVSTYYYLVSLVD